MPQFTINLPASSVTALSTKHGYQATLPDGSANTQPRLEYLRLYYRLQMINDTVEHELATTRAAVPRPMDPVIT